MMKKWQCVGCGKVWDSDREPLECGCGCRIVKEVQEPAPPTEPTPTVEPSGAFSEECGLWIFIALFIAALILLVSLCK